jgi:single-strand DNA-binding protein
MPNYNSVTVLGNCTRDPELRFTPNRTPVCDIAIAINRIWTDDDGRKQTETTFVDVTFWSRLAEIASEYLHKGSSAFIQGRLQQETWTDKQTGQPRSKLKVVAENLQLLEKAPIQVPLTQEQQSRAEAQRESAASAALTRQREAVAHQNLRQED